MLKVTPTLAIIMLLFATCTDHDLTTTGVCGVSDPANELAWLKAEIRVLDQSRDKNTHRYFYVSQATYQNQTVFIFGNCCPNCNTITPIKNCYGELLNNSIAEINGSITGEQILWASEDNECSFR
jgi:hypothetical protein